MSEKALAWLFLGFAIAFNTIGNLLVKKAGVMPASSKIEIFMSATFIAGAICFAMNLVGYTLAQGGLAISVAYPVLIALSMIGVSLGAWLFFGEVINLPQLGGMVLIVLGVIIVSIFSTG